MLTKHTLSAIGLFIVVISNPVLAAEGDEGKINLFTGNLGNVVWTLLIFLVVVLVLGKYAWGPMLRGLQKRESFIRESLASAKRDREEAEARLRDYDQKLKHAKEEAMAVMETGRCQGEDIKRHIEENASKSAEQMLERAKNEIAIARDAALRELYDQTSRLSMSMAGNVLKRQLTPEDHQKLIKETLAEVRKMPNSRN